jgi:hypothetical protein
VSTAFKPRHPALAMSDQAFPGFLIQKDADRIANPEQWKSNQEKFFFAVMDCYYLNGILTGIHLINNPVRTLNQFADGCIGKFRDHPTKVWVGFQNFSP